MQVERILQGVELAGRDVLDIGCGTGGATLHIAGVHAPRHVIGYDVEVGL